MEHTIKGWVDQGDMGSQTCLSTLFNPVQSNLKAREAKITMKPTGQLGWQVEQTYLVT